MPRGAALQGALLHARGARARRVPGAPGGAAASGARRARGAGPRRRPPRPGVSGGRAPPLHATHARSHAGGRPAAASAWRAGQCWTAGCCRHGAPLQEAAGEPCWSSSATTCALRSSLSLGGFAGAPASGSQGASSLIAARGRRAFFLRGGIAAPPGAARLRPGPHAVLQLHGYAMASTNWLPSQPCAARSRDAGKACTAPARAQCSQRHTYTVASVLVPAQASPNATALPTLARLSPSKACVRPTPAPRPSGLQGDSTQRAQPRQWSLSGSAVHPSIRRQHAQPHNSTVSAAGGLDGGAVSCGYLEGELGRRGASRHTVH